MSRRREQTRPFMQGIRPPLAQSAHEGIHLLQTLSGKLAHISLPFFCLDIRNCNVGTILSELFGYGCSETRRPASDERILTRKYREIGWLRQIFRIKGYGRHLSSTNHVPLYLQERSF